MDLSENNRGISQFGGVNSFYTSITADHPLKNPQSTNSIR